MRTLLVCGCFLLVCGWSACALRKSEPVKGAYFRPSGPEQIRGEQVYMIHCQKCHPGGEAGLGLALNSNPAPQFLKRFQVRHGLGVMPPFKKEELSVADLHAVSTYMKAWKHYR